MGSWVLINALWYDMSEPNPKKERKKVATTRSTSGAGFASRTWLPPIC